MEIALRGQPDKSVIIEEYNVKYPFSLSNYQNDPRMIQWDDFEVTAFAYSNLNTSKMIRVYVQRMIDIKDINNSSKSLSSADELFTIPPTSVSLSSEECRDLALGLHNMDLGVYKTTMNIIKINKGWIQSETNLAPTTPAGEQEILFENTYFGLVCENDKYSKMTLKPRLKDLPYFLFTNLENAKKTIRFSFKYDSPLDYVYAEYMKFEMKLKYK